MFWLARVVVGESSDEAKTCLWVATLLHLLEAPQQLSNRQQTNDVTMGDDATNKSSAERNGPRINAARFMLRTTTLHRSSATKINATRTAARQSRGQCASKAALLSRYSHCRPACSVSMWRSRVEDCRSFGT